MQTIRFSPQFFSLLKKLTNVSKSKATLLFSSNGRFHVNIPSTATFLHLSAGPNDFSFDGGEVNVASLMEFINFADLVGYPGQGMITVDDETLSNGHTYPMIKFSNGTDKTSTRIARCICADPTMFGKSARKIPAKRFPDPNEPGAIVDPMHLLATVALSNNELTTFCKQLKLVPGCQFVSALVNTKKVAFYMKGRTGQQITNDVDHKCVMLGNKSDIELSYDTNGKPKLRKFPAVYFNVLKGIDTDYEMEIRHSKGGATDKVMLKSFASIPGADPNDPIVLYAGAIECDGAEINAEALVL